MHPFAFETRSRDGTIRYIPAIYHGVNTANEWLLDRRGNPRRFTYFCRAVDAAKREIAQRRFVHEIRERRDRCKPANPLTIWRDTGARP